MSINAFDKSKFDKIKKELEDFGKEYIEKNDVMDVSLIYKMFKSLLYDIGVLDDTLNEEIRSISSYMNECHNKMNREIDEMRHKIKKMVNIYKSVDRDEDGDEDGEKEE